MNNNVKQKKTKSIKKVVDITPDVNKVTLNTEMKIYNQFIIENIPFRIYINGQLIFDTKNILRKDYPIFKEEDFILLNKNYPYKGITVERY